MFLTAFVKKIDKGGYFIVVFYTVVCYSNIYIECKSGGGVGNE